KKPELSLSYKDKLILNSKVRFYKKLSVEEKNLFEFKVSEFLANVEITGVGIGVNRSDELLVASSAVIPIFRFPGWQYVNVTEVLLYPNSFNEDFQFFDGKVKADNIGMVGDGVMNNKMILSKPDLHWGFANEWDGSNVGIHEFVHLIDKADGSVDGIPKLFLEKQYIVPWVELIQKNIEEIYRGRSDINPYGSKDKTEFFAVVSEYFFENPEKFKANHPDLYELMEMIFRTKDSGTIS
ncbi:MAG: zinc-dependent peptidase, partial [Candidatus Delongbacteria bacterium]|nr:zinc-dependent peptidase [Candidatus Delongbacteria bacterium]MCG2760324.1 zinc-dependent peptidase [Candidatus Delongbacteria bacterium]